MGKHLLSKATGISATVKTASGKASAVRAIDPQDDAVTLEVGKDKEEVTEVIKTTVRDFAKASDKEKEYKAEKDQAAAFLRKYVGDMRDENALEGDYQKTYRILGPTGKGGLQYAADVSQADKFSMPKDADLIEGLKDKLDKETFDENFEKVLTIQIKPEILKNDKKRREFSKVIIEAIGVEGLQKYFQKEEVYQVKAGLDKRQYEMEEEDRESILDVVKPSADSVKNTSYTE
jgi:hypothetical protein